MWPAIDLSDLVQTGHRFRCCFHRADTAAKSVEVVAFKQMRCNAAVANSTTVIAATCICRCLAEEQPAILPSWLCQEPCAWFWCEVGLSAVWAFTIFACFSTSEDNVRGTQCWVVQAANGKFIYNSQDLCSLNKHGKMQALYLFESLIFEADDFIFR